jgi:polysaccharide export outer membrane protein
MKLAAAFGCCLAAGLAGCGWLPTDGPTASEVVKQHEQDHTPRFDVVDVDDHVVRTLLARPAASFHTTFARYGKPPEPKIGVGDTISVTIWEASGGGLFGAAPISAVTTGARSATIPPQMVGTDGAISVPFAGRVPARGRTPLQVQHEIEARLQGKAIEPQVIVTITNSVTDVATVSGEVIAGRQVPLSLNGEHLLDLIAAAGGAKAPVYETFVRLSRDGVTATIPMAALVANPKENIYARPGDVLTLIQVPQSYSVFGAAGKNEKVTFNAEHLTLAEALAKAGGLQDLRSDPAGVFLFRFEPGPVVKALHEPLVATGTGAGTPVVYRLDMSDANAYFLAQRFPIEDKDIIYVANAELNELQKFFDLLNTLTGPVITGIVVRQSVP